MLTLSDAFTTAADASGHEPIWLVELPQVLIYLSTHAKTFGRTWRIGEGISLGSGWRLGGVRAAYDGRIAENGMGRLRRALDDTAQVSRVSGAQITLLNQDDWIDIHSDKILDSTQVRILMGFRDLPYTAFVPLFTGVIDNLDESLTAVVLDITDTSLRAHRNLSTPIGGRYFPGAPVTNRGKSIPILIGRNTDVTAHKVIGDATATLAFSLVSGANELLLNEIGAPFPDSGEITVGTETGVTYTARSFQTINGVTYLQLEGLTRGAPVTQNAGDAVTPTSVAHTHLVGYETGDVTAVRAAGALVDPADYTVSVDSTAADRPVTIVTFDSEPTTPVTIDADGRNVDPSEIANGGFESGDTTGWTNGSGTPTVSTTAPFGTYKLELVGSEGAYEDIYTDFSTTPGRSYTAELSYQDNMPGSNLLTNGSFESGDLTGWTEDTSQIVSLTGQAVQATFLSNPVVGTLIAYDDTAEGNWKLRVGSISPGRNTYVIYQDVATTASVDYVFSFAHLGYYYVHASSGANAVYSYTYWYSQFRYKLSTDDDATIYHDVTLDYRRGQQSWEELAPVSFTAVSTTTRIEVGVEIYTNQTWAPSAFLDNVQLVQASNFPTSQTAVKLGTTGDDTAYADATLPPRYGWTPYSIAFVATETQTRITLRSQWIDMSAASYFDEVRLHDGGRNPADAIAYIIDTFLSGAFVRDTASFNTAYGKLSGWQFGGLLTNPGNSKTLLDNMAWQCNSRLVYSAAGQVRMQVRDGVASGTLPILTADTMVDGTFRARREPLQNLYSEFVIWWGRTGDTTDDQIDKNFQASVTANASATTHPSLPLDSYCQAAIDTYGVRRKLERRAEMIRDLPTAHRLLQVLVERHTQRQIDVRLRVFHSVGVQLEEGDYVEVFYQRLQGGQIWLCEVLSKEIGPADVALMLRTVNPLGFFEPWDFPLTLVEGERFFEPWEA